MALQPAQCDSEWFPACPRSGCRPLWTPRNDASGVAEALLRFGESRGGPGGRQPPGTYEIDPNGTKGVAVP
eukprot:14494055-Alexandrium_andersonii.AAC.1